MSFRSSVTDALNATRKAYSTSNDECFFIFNHQKFLLMYIIETGTILHADECHGTIYTRVLLHFQVIFLPFGAFRSISSDVMIMLLDLWV